MDKNELLAADHISPTFPELFVTKPAVVIRVPKGSYQMKDMDKIFLQIPFRLTEVEWFRYYSLSKSSIFSKS